MSFFLTGTFWFFEGILFCLAIIGLKIYSDEINIKLDIWKWLAIIVWIFLFEFTIAFITTSLGENEPTAALMGGILFGIISIVSGVALYRFIFISGMTNPDSGDDEEV